MSDSRTCAACGEYMPPHAPHMCSNWTSAIAMDEKAIKDLLAEQANDEGLWFEAETAAEAYLQRALRRLHAAIEGKSSKQCAIETLTRGQSGEAR